MRRNSELTLEGTARRDQNDPHGSDPLYAILISALSSGSSAAEWHLCPRHRYCSVDTLRVSVVCGTWRAVQRSWSISPRGASDQRRVQGATAETLIMILSRRRSCATEFYASSHLGRGCELHESATKSSREIAACSNCSRSRFPCCQDSSPRCGGGRRRHWEQSQSSLPTRASLICDWQIS
jgi:hypothetical protein